MKAFLALLSLVLATGAQAQTAKEKFELSERCGKQAAERFAGWDKPSAAYAKYENHYNSRLNKCFYLTIVYDPEFQMFSLEDVHENKDVGFYRAMRFVPQGPVQLLNWRVQAQRCGSEDEWRALINPFLED